MTKMNNPIWAFSFSVILVGVLVVKASPGKSLLGLDSV